MNKIMIIAITIVSFLSCNNNREGDQKQVKGESQEVVQNENDLQLNDGKKWMLDSLTRKNISVIKKLLTDSETRQDKVTLANNLQQQVDLLVSECKMTGDDHKALHQWLEDFIEDLKKFKKSADDEKVFSTLQKDLEQFDGYFQ